MSTKTLIRLITLILFCLPSRHGKAKEYFRFDDSIRIENANFSFFHVNDKRPNKENIGFLRKGLNIKTKLQTEKPFGSYFSEYINRIADRNSTGDTLMLVLYDFCIEDRPNQDELGTFHFDGMFYLGSNDKYAFVSEVDTFFELRENWDVTRLLIETSQNYVVEILSAVSNLSREKSTTFFNSTQLLTHREDSYREYAVYKATTFKGGIYYTVKAFVDQTPVDTPFIIQTRVTNRIKTVFFNYMNNKDKPGVMIWDWFAIIKDGQMYFKEQHIGSKLKIVNGGIYANQYFKGIPRKESQSPYMFGLTDFLVETSSTAFIQGYGLYEARLDPVKARFKPVRRIL